MSVLNRSSIIKRIKERDYNKKLVVTPLLEPSQIGPASIDVRLGSSIIIPKKIQVDKHDVTNRHMIRELEQRLYDHSRLKYHDKFILHPSQLILGVTFEYISLPQDLFCMIVSRSSWGRLGLVVATAAAVQPGYKGCLTLELANVSESPIALYPGLPIGQLVIHRIEEVAGDPAQYCGRYKCPTEAEVPRFYDNDTDAEIEFWGQRLRRNGG